jgi:hypothetical protein
MKMAGSGTVDLLAGMLSNPKRPAIAIFGESDELTAATLEAALAKVPPSNSYSSEPICFVGDAQYGSSLAPLVEGVGTKLFVVANR